MLFTLLFLTVVDSTQVVRIATAPGEELVVTIKGAGPAVVLLPGMFGSAFTYRHVTEMLAGAGYRSFVVGMLGMGASDRPKDGDYSLMAQADRVGAVLDSLNVAEAVFVGHSIAASVAMRLAYRRRGMVTAIVSVEGGPTEAAATAGFRRLMRLAPAIRMSGALRGLPALIRREMRQVSRQEDWITRELLAGYTGGLMADMDATMDAFQGMARAEEPSSLADSLSLVACPVILLVSQQTHKSGPNRDEVMLMTDRLQAFVIDTVLESGYFIQEEQPSAILDAVLRLELTPN